MLAAAARLAAHQARVSAATAPIILTYRRDELEGEEELREEEEDEGNGGASGSGGGANDASGGGVRFGDALVVTTGDSNPCVLAADALGGAPAGVWSWGADGGDPKQPPPPAVPAAAAQQQQQQQPARGTACTALRVLSCPTRSGGCKRDGDALRFGDRFALALVDPASVLLATGAGGCGGGDPSLLLLLASRAPLAAHSPWSRLPGGGGGAPVASANPGQAVAFVPWRPRGDGSPPPSDAAWVALPAARSERVVGAESARRVRAGEPLILLHAPTRRPLFCGGGGSGGVSACWAAGAGGTRGDDGVIMGPPALAENVWRFS
jgi:hypothetical protein